MKNSVTFSLQLEKRKISKSIFESSEKPKHLRLNSRKIQLLSRDQKSQNIDANCE